MKDSQIDDPFAVLITEEEPTAFLHLAERDMTAHSAVAPTVSSVATARFVGFDLADQPLVTALPDLPGEVIPARTTVDLALRDIGATVVLMFEQNDRRRPLIVGVVIDSRRPSAGAAAMTQPIAAQVDDERLVLTAKREIVLQCGAASITLTRAGKVIIKGAYVLSRSSGCNKIKGAMVDIN